VAKSDPSDRFVWKKGDITLVKRGDGKPVEQPEGLKKEANRRKNRPKSRRDIQRDG
jgi:hypothetical protein